LPVDSDNRLVAQNSLNILQVSSADISGGAEKVAWNLFQTYRKRGCKSWLTVGDKYSSDADVFQIRNDSFYNYWALLCDSLGDILSPLAGRVRGANFLRKQLYRAGRPNRLLAWWRGVEDFNFPGSWRILDMTPRRPDIVHCHNLHKEYFDLRALPWLSRQLPVFMTLHDAWLLSGHCAHSFDCERWQIGCGQCPDLALYPAVRRDATAHNWRRKRDIFAQSNLRIAAPSQWLMDKIQKSILAPAIVEARIIRNGVDLSVFHPADREAARLELGMPRDGKILLFAANGIRWNKWKDYPTLRAAIARIAGHLQSQGLVFIALGEEGANERIGSAEIRFVAFKDDPQAVARYYQAADVYVHAARVDTFPLTVLEALACGTPVVATGVGGIPEQVEDGVTGFLVPCGDEIALAERVEQLLGNDALIRRMSVCAAAVACQRFDLNSQALEYLEWYNIAMESRKTKAFAPENLLAGG
jgi:glycosyltransferase involved in cell wall biosynthesis